MFSCDRVLIHLIAEIMGEFDVPAITELKDNLNDLEHTELYPEHSLGKFKNQLSDHLPLWLEVDTWIDDELLEQILLQEE